MAGNKTFTIIKPDAFRAGNSGSIIKIIEKAGFGIQNMRLLEMDMEMASNSILFIKKDHSLKGYVITCALVQL